MGYSHGRQWTETTIRGNLEDVSLLAGRMSTLPELRAQGMGDLAEAIKRRGGVKYWANTLSLSLKGTETHRGQHVENEVAMSLSVQGFLVKRMTTRASYDLLVNERIRVDVKSAQYGEYGKNNYVKGFVFGLHKKVPTCDLYILCGVSHENIILWQYFIPANKAMVRMITITPNGKYTKYKGAINVLENMLHSF